MFKHQMAVGQNLEPIDLRVLSILFMFGEEKPGLPVLTHTQIIPKNLWSQASE